MNKLNKPNFRYLGIIILVLSSLFFIPLAFAQQKSAYIDTTLINQDPYPAEPNAYVEFLVKFENRGMNNVRDFMTEIVPEYPFSLDPGSNGVIKIGSIDGLQKDGEAIFAKYKVRIDKDALDGDNKIKIRYAYNTNGLWDNYWEKEFFININDPKTDFDVAVQDFSPTTKSLSLSISNIGNKDANSVTISIPDQTAYEFLGTDKSIVGNIAKNDYTTATFKINPKQDGPLIIKIAYTDSIGIRREIEKTIIFKASAFTPKANNNQQSTLGKSLIYIIVGVVGLIVVFIFLRILIKKRKK